MQNPLKHILPVIILFILAACGERVERITILVRNIDELNQAIEEAQPGDDIVLAKGIWNDAPIKFYGIGTEAAPITLRAETPGEVFIEGQSYLHLGGEYLLVSGLHFRNGYSPNNGIIRYMIGEDSVANHSRVTSCVVDKFTQPSRLDSDRWIEFWGNNNQMDHCYIAGKSNDGNTLMIYHTGNEHTNNHHQIIYNYFGPRPRKGGPRAETVRTGNPQMTPGYANVSNNFFDRCNGEVEIVSDKADYNTFRNNIFYKCEGSLVLRHANYGTVDGNIFIGGDDSDFYGGIRLVNTGHWVTNNYLYKIRGDEFRTPLAMMNGIPNSIQNRYKQVTDAVIAYNTWVDCKSPWQIGIGQNRASAEVLPATEIRSLPPIRTTIANNLIYNTQVDPAPIVDHDSINGILFRNNIIDNNGSEYSQFGVLQNVQLSMKQINDWLYVPAEGQNAIMDQVYDGYDFGRIKNDLFGSSREESNRIGAISQLAVAEQFAIDKKKYGPAWFSTEQKKTQPNILTASSDRGDLNAVIVNAKSGDIIELSDESYIIDAPISIDKEITIRSAGVDKASIQYTGRANTPAFEMNPYGIIRLDNVSLAGDGSQLAFAPLDSNMSAAYYLFVDNSDIDGFKYVLKASQGSFADSIQFSNTVIRNCENGFVLAADEKGDYNAEMVSFMKCSFENIQQNVIHFYRGGYDESTIGGFLTLFDNTFSACGARDNSGMLIKTPGIINVIIEGNTFRNNPVEMTALLWGAKNNHHRDNTFIQTSSIRVEQQRKLDILY